MDVVLYNSEAGVTNAEVAKIRSPRLDYDWCTSLNAGSICLIIVGCCVVQDIIRKPNVSIFTKWSISWSLSPRLLWIFVGGDTEEGVKDPSGGGDMAPSESGGMVEGEV